MPYKLSQEEKDALLQKYQENVNNLNNAMPEQYREDYGFKFDRAAFNKNVNDPDKAWMYKKAMEVRAREEKKKEIQERLSAEMADLRIPGKEYPLERFLHTDLIASDDPEAEAYNREKVRMYLLHPEAVTQKRFQKLLDSNVEQLAALSQCKNKDSLMVAWSDKNSETVEMAYEAFGTIVKFDKELLSPEMKKYHSSILRNYEMMMDSFDMNRKMDDAYFTLPIDMTADQENALGAGLSFEEDHPVLSKQVMQNPTNKQEVARNGKRLEKFFKDAKDKKIDLKGNGALTSYVAKTGNENAPFASVGAYLDNVAGPNATLTKISAEELAGLKKIFKVDYTKEPGYKEPEIPAKFKTPAWQEARDEIVLNYAIKLDKPMHEIDNGGLVTIAESFKGGLGERLFRTTSHEYNNFVQTMKDFDNENHVNFHNSKPVKMAANDYLIHRGVKTREEALALPSPAKERATLCFDVLESFQKAEPVAEDKLIPGTREILKGPDKEWPPAIEDPSLVDDDTMFGNLFEEKAPAPQLDIAKDIEDPQIADPK